MPAGKGGHPEQAELPICLFHTPAHLAPGSLQRRVGTHLTCLQLYRGSWAVAAVRLLARLSPGLESPGLAAE